jgi:hypothetical protein
MFADQGTYAWVVQEVNTSLLEHGIKTLEYCRQIIDTIKYERGKTELSTDLEAEVADYYKNDSGTFTWDEFTFAGEIMVENSKGKKERQIAWGHLVDDEESVESYMLRVRQYTLSVVDFAYVILNMNWDIIPLDVQEYQILRFLYGFDKKYFSFGRHNKFKSSNRIPSRFLIPMIENFFVANVRDVGRQLKHSYGNIENSEETIVGYLIAFFCNQTNNNGPRVLFINERIGYGLFARRDYAPGEFITRYGGRVMSHDPAQGFETEKERKESAAYSTYIVSLTYGEGDADAIDDPTYQEGKFREFDYVIDGELCWKIRELGRFVNSTNDNRTQNARYKIEMLDTRMKFGRLLEAEKRRASLRLCNVVAEVAIKAGDEIRTHYGEMYLQHLEISPSPLKHRRIQSCIQCRAAPVAAKCGGPCGRALYCGQACADAHVDAHACVGERISE